VSGRPLLGQQDGAGAAVLGPAGLAGLAQWWRDSVAEPLLSVLFPPRCVGCGDFETHLCARCRQSLVAIGADACPRCGEPGPRPSVGGRCSHCMAREVAYAGSRSAFVHAGAARRLVVEFKSGGQPVLARTMAALAGEAFGEVVAVVGPPERVLVTWVPCHPAARRRRGYNQAELLARALAAGVPGLASAGLVRKTTSTRHQKALGRAGRQSNLRGAFALDERAAARLSPPPAGLVLVDDVYTTGATAHEVSLVLSSGMGLPVHVFTFSRAVSGSLEGHD
jgi:predicted amidophosphoribosyltransferase